MYAISRAKTRYQEPEQGQEQGKQHYECAACGCPLPGGISSTIGPEAKFYCCFHFNADIREFDGITHKIRMNLALVRQWQVMQILAREPYWISSDEYLDERTQAYQFAEYPKKDGIDHYAYVDALRGEIQRRLYPPTGGHQKTRPTGSYRPRITDLLTRIGSANHISTYLPDDAP